MKKTVILSKGMPLSYEIKRKQVKNLNLHIENDGRVWLSAGMRHSEKEIEAFVLSKEAWILKHLDKLSQQESKERVPYFSEAKLTELIHGFCRELFPCFSEKGISYPQIKFRKMTSQWGNCRPKQRILTFNKNLCFAPKDCIFYVVCHEWVHFLVPNHSEKFYRELEKICPNWKELRKQLKEVTII